MAEETLEDKLAMAADHAVLLRYYNVGTLSGRKGNFVQVFLTNASDEPDIVKKNQFHKIENGSLSPYEIQGEQILNSLGINPKIMPLEKQMEEIEEQCLGRLMIAYPSYKVGNPFCFKNGSAHLNFEFINTEDTDLDYYVVPIVSTTDLNVLKRGNEIQLTNWFCDIFGTPEYLLTLDNQIHKVELQVVEDADFSFVKLKDKNSIHSYFSRYLSLPEYVIKRDFLEGYCFVRKDIIPAIFNRESVSNETTLSKEKDISQRLEEPSSQEFFEQKRFEAVSDTSSIKSKTPGQIDEEEVLNNFLEYTKRRHLCYDELDIMNFQACVNTRMLTILAGMSGTGKTRLPKVYADYFKMREYKDDNSLASNNTLLFLPISPSYTEPSDVLGFYDITTQTYYPAETGLVEFLMHALNHKDKMHMVIFDEMNLSQIEYWFAPFLSVLEKDLGERKLQLFSNSFVDKGAKHIPSSINIGDNIIFIGTINLDETTKALSDRLLDRSFVINLQKTKFEEAGNLLTKEKEDTSDIEFVGEDLRDIVTDSKFLININYFAELQNLMGDNSKLVLKFFDELDLLLRKNDVQKGVSFRALRNIVIFLMSWPHKEGTEISYQLPFDYAIKQTVLKKISGPRETMESIVGTPSSKENADPDNSTIIDLFNKYSALSNFEKSREDIRSKAKELNDNDYIR